MALSVGSTILASDINDNNFVLPSTGGTFGGAITIPYPLKCIAPNTSTSTYLQLQGSTNNNINAKWMTDTFRGNLVLTGSTNLWTVTYAGKNQFRSRPRDLAEGHISTIKDPGRCVTPNNEGIMIPSTERLQLLCGIISDTYGFNIGAQDNTVPIAMMGRVLAYTYQDRNNYPLGAAVCSAPDGTIDLMTREEIMEYPDRIIGTVSEIPQYDTWHFTKASDSPTVQVNNRIWIYIK